MQRLKVLTNQEPTLPQPTNNVVAQDNTPTPRKSMLRAQRQDLVRPKRLTVVAAMLQVGEPIYKCFRCQKLPVFSGSTNLAEAKDWFKKIQRIFRYMGLEDHEKVA